jgi:hypothetical protein
VSPGEFVSKIPHEHQDLRERIKRVQHPDWPERQIADVEPVHEVACIDQNHITQAVGAQIPGFVGFYEHREIPADEQK